MRSVIAVLAMYIQLQWCLLCTISYSSVCQMHSFLAMFTRCGQFQQCLLDAVKVVFPLYAIESYGRIYIITLCITFYSVKIFVGHSLNVLPDVFHVFLICLIFDLFFKSSAFSYDYFMCFILFLNSFVPVRWSMFSPFLDGQSPALAGTTCHLSVTSFNYHIT